MKLPNDQSWHIVDNRIGGGVVASGDTLLQALDMCPLKVFQRKATDIWCDASTMYGYSIVCRTKDGFIGVVKDFHTYRVDLTTPGKDTSPGDFLNVVAPTDDAARFIAEAVVLCAMDTKTRYVAGLVTQLD
jgi:hypothetical protein